MKFQDFPDEILLDIFEQLDYWDLRLAVPATCKRFRRLILAEGGSGSWRIDQTIFRDAPYRLRTPDNPTNELEQYPSYKWKAPRKYEHIGYFNGTYHPAFTMLSYWLEDNVKAFYFGRTEETCVRLVDTPIAHENATSPAVRELIVQVACYPHLWVTSSTAVSVLDVLLAVVQSYHTLIIEDSNEYNPNEYYSPGTKRLDMRWDNNNYEWPAYCLRDVRVCDGKVCWEIPHKDDPWTPDDAGGDKWDDYADELKARYSRD